MDPRLYTRYNYLSANSLDALLVPLFYEVRVENATMAGNHKSFQLPQSHKGRTGETLKHFNFQTILYLYMLTFLRLPIFSTILYLQFYVLWKSLQVKKHGFMRHIAVI